MSALVYRVAKSDPTGNRLKLPWNTFFSDKLNFRAQNKKKEEWDCTGSGELPEHATQDRNQQKHWACSHRGSEEALHSWRKDAPAGFYSVFSRHGAVNRYVKVNCVYIRFIHPEVEPRCALWNHRFGATSQGPISVSSFIHPPQVTADKLLSPPSALPGNFRLTSYTSTMQEQKDSTFSHVSICQDSKYRPYLWN